jgi:hypothetical protein
MYVLTFRRAAGWRSKAQGHPGKYKASTIASQMYMPGQGMPLVVVAVVPGLQAAICITVEGACMQPASARIPHPSLLTDTSHMPGAANAPFPLSKVLTPPPTTPSLPSSPGHVH